MAKDKASFILYTDQITTFEMLSNEEAGILIKHIYNYVNDKNPILEDRLLQVAFSQIQATFKRNLKQYEKQCDKNSENGKYSALKKNNNDLYIDVKSEKLTLDEALEIAKDRKDNKTVEPVLKTPKEPKVKKDITEREEQFEKVWNIYDHKTGKKRALSYWLKLKESDIEKIRHTIVDYVANVKESGRHRKHLSTYLSDENWNDELIKKENKTSNGLTTVEKVIDLFDAKDLTANIKLHKTNKANLKVRLVEFLERESIEAEFKHRSLEDVFKHFTRAIGYKNMTPEEATDLEAKRQAEERWTNKEEIANAKVRAKNTDNN